MDLWNDEEPIGERFEDVTVPAWIESDTSPYDVAAIARGGCASGAYMPAVTYYKAMQTMAEHGDDVLQFIEDRLGELPQPQPVSWSGLACSYLSTAVELWAAETEATLENYEPEEEDTDEAA